MNLKPYLSWCAAQGVVSPLDVRVRSTDGYRYTVWKEDLQQSPESADLAVVDDGDSDNSNRQKNKVNLIQCPLSSCLQAESGLELADKLSYEASLGDESRFAPYIQVLPPFSAFQDSLPRFWNEQRCDRVYAADGGFLSMTLKDDQDRIELAKDPWALSCVDSRANILPGGIYSLTPFLDMINHDATVPTSARLVEDDTLLCLDVAKESLVLPPPKPVSSPPPSLFGNLFRNMQSAVEQPQPEVRISYGPLTNLQTLVNYGFVQRDNPRNTEFLQIDMLQCPSVILEVKADGSLDPFSVGTLRWNLATSEEREIVSGDNMGGPMVPFLSERNEKETYAVIAGFLEENIYQANEGAANANKEGDTIVRDYLEERHSTLKGALDKIGKRFPDLLLLE